MKKIVPVLLPFVFLLGSVEVSFALPKCEGSPRTISVNKWEVSSWSNCEGTVALDRKAIAEKLRDKDLVIIEDTWELLTDEEQKSAESIKAIEDMRAIVQTKYQERLEGLHQNFEMTYVGEWKDGKRNGQGTETFEWKNGSGQGKYVGEWKDGKRNGQGTDELKNGSGQGKYVGEWKDGKRNGQGTETFEWKDGSGQGKYVGEWKDDKKNGQGTETLSDERKYVGEWKDGKRNGQGTYTHHTGTYVGEWKAGKMNGQGTLTLSDGKKYVGEFKDGKYPALDEVGDTWMVAEPKAKPFFVSKSGMRYWPCSGLINKQLIENIYKGLSGMSRKYGVAAPLKNPCHYTIALTPDLSGKKHTLYTVNMYTSDLEMQNCVYKNSCLDLRNMTFMIVNKKLALQYLILDKKRDVWEYMCWSRAGKIINERGACK